MTIKHSVSTTSFLRTITVVALFGLAAGFTTSVQASSSGRTTASCAPGSVKRLVSGSKSYAVDARGLVRAYRSPDARRAFARFGPLNVNGVPTVFAAVEAVMGKRCRAAWYRVQLPMKPNEVTGYVRARSVNLRPVRSRVVVDLSARKVALYRSGKLVLQTRAAIGATGTPTPLGSYYVNQRFRTDVNGPFGWAAIGISAFSEVLTGWVQGGPVAIHGTNNPSLLGLRVSNGCIRVSNDVIRRLWQLAPTGTPVLIQQ
jgi:lipoprotein-anchoring transpeptidase ErfK/SrfK